MHKVHPGRQPDELLDTGLHPILSRVLGDMSIRVRLRLAAPSAVVGPVGPVTLRWFAEPSHQVPSATAARGLRRVGRALHVLARGGDESDASMILVSPKVHMLGLEDVGEQVRSG